MLTYERHETILQLLEKQKIAKLAELVNETGASESTIRRDLTILENEKKIKRIHGGASLLKRKVEEPSMIEKQQQFTVEKQQMGEKAAGFIKDGDSLFIDAGTSTQAILPYIKAKDVVIVTNGLNIIEEAINLNFRTYVLGGYVKSGTHAFVGKGAVEAIQQFQFDKAFIGTNGVDLNFGYSTPDPEEAQIKHLAIKQSNHSFVLADSSKFGDVTFAKFADLNEAVLITTEGDDDEFFKKLKQIVTLEVVKDDDIYSNY
ncbi:DeoR/GlpR transcriptional regulator [Salipaludibacillus agaradhaerens]|uniref:DeoR/GlpR transcriptional regulator n=1 Tax=Salipaludibacillus agaradhaerens TaxID=76935 RepID=A0A9Q4FY60_SALAG|nr:DeoR/GlpR family DNA-binding transcription regulator [Salipaludibacillus agaradhaerens]MCR6095388.1 DeoR/GlpR transcriptional regulator [Salipaludibacillus agaradhaerens]MCR6115054.1 DeoR/GlpR transcriptional regulator [Salipaludibacillus agaradhaerens]